MRVPFLLVLSFLALPALCQDYYQQQPQAQQIAPAQPLTFPKVTDTPELREAKGKSNLFLMDLRFQEAVLDYQLHGGGSKDHLQHYIEMAKVYDAAGKDRFQARAILQDAIGDCWFKAGVTKNIAQATQYDSQSIAKLQILQCAQNQRIIELLEYIATKK